MVTTSYRYNWKDWMSFITILVISFSGSLTAAVRYGFLADSFSEKNVEPKYYGLIGGSMFAGFLLAYMTRTTEVLLRRFTPKTLLQWDQTLNLLYPLGCILTYRYINDDVSLLVTLNIVLRIYNGFLGYPRCLLLIDLCRSQFTRDFDSVNSMTQLGVYAGHGLGAAMGSALYDYFGYNAPFYLVTAMLILPITMTYFFIPDCPSHSASSCSEESDHDSGIAASSSEESLTGDSAELLKEPMLLKTNDYGTVPVKGKKYGSRLSWWITLPLLSTMLVNIVYGYLQITITPYLNIFFHVPISQGGLVLSTVSVGMVVGSATSAYLLKGPKISPYSQMFLGSLCVGIGVLLMFPVEYIRPLYRLSPITAYPAAFLAGFGDPLITIATLSAMKKVQIRHSGAITADQEMFIGGTWLIGFLAFCFAGQGLAGFMLEYFTYWAGALILGGMSVVSMMIGLALYLRYTYT